MSNSGDMVGPTDADGCVLAEGHEGPHEFVDQHGKHWLWETDWTCDCEHCSRCDGDYCFTYWRKPDACAVGTATAAVEPHGAEGWCWEKGALLLGGPMTAVSPSADLDVNALLRGAEEQKAARATLLPTEHNCIASMVQARMRLLDLGWRSGEYAPRDGSHFEGVIAGFTGPSECTWLGSGFFAAAGGDWWPVPRPMVFRPLPGKTPP